MIRIFRHPAVNACCLSLFTALYAAVFFLAARTIAEDGLACYAGWQPGGSVLWRVWCAALAAGRHRYIAYGMIAVTAAVVVLLCLRRHAYDEYHTALLLQCLVIATVLTLAAIAVFYLLILSDPSGVIAKFTLFIAIHWVTVVLADLVYVLLCRWK